MLFDLCANFALIFMDEVPCCFGEAGSYVMNYPDNEIWNLGFKMSWQKEN